MELKPISLTERQKLQALAFRFYQHYRWTPRAGDHYTTSRDDLELYQVVCVRDGKVFTRYCDGGKTRAISEWPEDEFLAEHTFGRCRVFVPDFILGLMTGEEWSASRHPRK